ncbi:MAG: serine/threonine protein phosphatase [Rhodobacterales bacterium CG2_30_65_12]|nr:MAG: serine/threonine protein phosphatase [Rhodobacterales bacterium CG2_30_65_12]
MRVYAIGDVHGYLCELERAHALIAADRARTGDSTAPVVHIGDLCDRGPDTRGVIAFLLAGLERGENWIALKGNHDRMMAWFLEQSPRIDPYMIVGWDWFHEGVGGRETLASYGIEIAERERWFQLNARARRLIPKAHLQFVQGLPCWWETGEHIFVHAGIRPGVPMAEQTETDLVWIRHEFHDDPRDHGKLVIHGHTPVKEITHYGNRVNLDVGAGYGKPLVPVVIEGGDVWALTQDGRVAVTRG